MSNELGIRCVMNVGTDLMNDRNFTMELSDGTVIEVGATAKTRHPDVKAFYLPTGVMHPFTSQNLPTARRDQEGDRSVSANVFSG